jgi:hypothetical protein
MGGQGLFTEGFLMKWFSFLFVVLAFSAQAQGNPSLEGVYDVTLDCGQSSLACKKIHGQHPLVIMYTQPLNGTVVTIVYEKFAFPMYSFPDVAISEAGNEFLGYGKSPQAFAEMQLRLNPITKTIAGEIVDARFSDTIRVSGKLRTSMEKLYQTKSLSLRLDDIVGVYKGRNNASIRLILRKSFSGGNIILASAEINEHAAIGFSHGDFQPETGVVRLWAPQRHNPFGFLKWTLAVGRNSEGRLTLSGLAFSNSHGKMREISLTRVNGTESLP